MGETRTKTMATRRFADLVAALQRRYLFFFLVGVFRALHPGQPALRPVWYLMAMCHALEQATSGALRRLVISVPPRHLKSITAAVALVAWKLGHDPSLKIMVATYSDKLAREHADACRMIMEQSWYKRLFPQTRIREGSNRQLEFKTTKGGGRQAVSVTGSITGFGADIIILDDCMKADEIESEAARNAVDRWYSSTLITRLNSKRDGVIISIQQRLGEDDLTAKLLALGFHHLCLPSIAEKDEAIPITEGRIYRRRIGDLLDPAREDRATLEALRREMGAFKFSAQIQQNPVAPEGNIIRIDRLARYDAPLPREQYRAIWQSWDTGMSALPTSDWSVCTTWGFRDDRWYLLDVCRRRLDYPDLRDAVIRLRQQWAADKVIIEDAGAGKSLWQELRSRGPFRPIMVTPAASKEERLRGQLGQIEDGRILFPREAPWLDAYLHELRAFPGRHDDQVDSTSQFLQHAMAKDAWLAVPIDPETGRRLYNIRKDRLNRRS